VLPVVPWNFISGCQQGTAAHAEAQADTKVRPDLTIELRAPRKSRAGS
jgi:hypothetical protein